MCVCIYIYICKCLPNRFHLGACRLQASPSDRSLLPGRAPAACGAPPGRAPPPVPHCGRVHGNQSSSPGCLGKLGPTRLDGYTNILHYIILYYIISYRIISYHIILYYVMLCYIVLYYSNYLIYDV